jgi:hypothetical protein
MNIFNSDQNLLYQSVLRWIEEYNRDNWVVVTAGIEEKEITICVYVEDEISDDDWDVLWMLGGYVIGDFSPEFKINEICKSIKKNKPVELDFYAINKINT